jgi:serine/threonine protein kinase
MSLTTEFLKFAIESEFDEFNISDGPISGTYGQIWFLKAKSSARSPQEIALKTMPPEDLKSLEDDNALEVLKREFNMWLSMPKHLNVVSAFGFEFLPLYNEETKSSIELPIMKMAKFIGSLEHWVDDRSFSYPDRLIALAQAFNGLRHLYKNGIEGHGDLKLSNILYKKFPINYKNKSENDFATGWPNAQNIWNVSVADLGWADAWVDLGYTHKAFRQYLAPERIDDRRYFEPISSDMFSMGIICAELIQGYHPVQNFKKSTKSNNAWLRSIRKSDWKLDGIASAPIKELILKCLSPNTKNRPTPDYVIDLLSSEIKGLIGVDIKPALEASNTQFHDETSTIEHLAWAAPQTTNLSDKQALKTKSRLKREYNNILISDLDSLKRWALIVQTLIQLEKKSEENEDLLFLEKLRNESKALMAKYLGGKIQSSKSVSDPAYKDWDTFEKLAEVIGVLAEIANIHYDSKEMKDLKLDHTSQAAFAFRLAGDLRYKYSSTMSDEKFEEVILLLNEAIDLAPDENTPKKFKKRWSQEREFLQKLIR